MFRYIGFVSKFSNLNIWQQEPCQPFKKLKSANKIEKAKVKKQNG